MKPPNKARTDRNKYALHQKKYKTFYMRDATLKRLDELKEQWFLNGRGKTIEKLIYLYDKSQQAETEEHEDDSSDIDRYV